MDRQSTEIRQEQIKRAVLSIITKEGLHAVSTRNLAKEVGVSEGTIFRHFNTKKDIFLGIMKDVNEELMLPLRDIAMVQLPPQKRLELFLCKHVKYLVENNGITILLFSHATHMNDTELKNNLREILIKQKQYISKIIQDGIVEGVWDSELVVESAAMLYMGIPITLNIEMILNPSGTDTDNFCKKMLCLVSRILKK